MRIEFELEGKPVTAEVDLAAGVIHVDGRELTFRVVSDTPSRTELEIAGEIVAVEGWPPGLRTPLEDTSVAGEIVRVRAIRSTSESSPLARLPSPAPEPTVSAAGDGEGGITAPMPGKVIEVRVREGQPVERGQVLVVLEAMKMRNELASPRAGTVRDLRAVPGANVRARELLLRVRVP